MTIAEVSRKYEISADTLRYYERIGLVPPVPRSKSGIRDYDEASCGWVELMKCMRAAGVQIEALIEYVNLFQQGDGTIDARKEPQGAARPARGPDGRNAAVARPARREDRPV